MTEGEQKLISQNAVPMNSSAILLLDDNAIQAATRQAILKRAGYFVIAALNPGRVLHQLQNDEFASPISIVITDHAMPGMCGAEFVRELRKTHPVLPVMVISGLDEAECEYTGMGVRFLMKPLSPDLLLSNLQELLLQPDEPDVDLSEDVPFQFGVAADVPA